MDIPADFRIEETPGKGKGVFATRDFKKGETILVFTGTWISADDVDERDDIRDDDPLQIADDAFLLLNPLPYLFNHSCDPNGGIRETSELFALRDIKAGEEITYDYSTTVSEDRPWFMPCRCGTPRCRKEVGNVGTIPRGLREGYCAAGAFPTFLYTRTCVS